MSISARNQLKGKVVEVILGGVMAHITIRIGQILVDSVITRKSAEELKLEKATPSSPSSKSRKSWFQSKASQDMVSRISASFVCLPIVGIVHSSVRLIERPDQIR